MSKIFERVILSQLSNFIDQEKLYKETQSGYRRGHSCVTLLTKMKDDIQEAMNRGEITLSICADFSKAFDTVCYETLFNKLITLKFSRQSIELLYSYLSNRVQYVQINDQKSSKSTLKYGELQGSILGPILLTYMYPISLRTYQAPVYSLPTTQLFTNIVKSITLILVHGVCRKDLTSLVLID